MSSTNSIANPIISTSSHEDVDLSKLDNKKYNESVFDLQRLANSDPVQIFTVREWLYYFLNSLFVQIVVVLLVFTDVAILLNEFSASESSQGK